MLMGSLSELVGPSAAPTYADFIASEQGRIKYLQYVAETGDCGGEQHALLTALSSSEGKVRRLAMKAVAAVARKSERFRNYLATRIDTFTKRVKLEIRAILRYLAFCKRKSEAHVSSSMVQPSGTKLVAA
ncbi:MAG: hypothetical protein K0S20_189 [Patescibacteria group bacterium]|nr:hypothetical protein [Patescibacteria group bacterium]